MTTTFDRLYWKNEFDWVRYAQLYSNYCKTAGNYYAESAKKLLEDAKLKKGQIVLDLACGTGVMTKVVLEHDPDARIIALDLSSEQLRHYRMSFAQQIERGQITVIEGNAEHIDELLTEKIDVAFIASALWNMKYAAVLKELLQVLSPEGKIVLNIPHLYAGKPSALLYEIEQTFIASGAPKRFPRLTLSALEQTAELCDLQVVATRDASFKMSKRSKQDFLELLEVRFPFIFFEDEQPLEERIAATKKITAAIYDQLKESDVEEELIAAILQKTRKITTP